MSQNIAPTKLRLSRMEKRLSKVYERKGAELEERRLTTMVNSLKSQVKTLEGNRDHVRAEVIAAERRKLQGREPQYRIGRPPTCR